MPGRAGKMKLIDHRSNVRKLGRLITRVGADMSPEGFIRAVSIAFYATTSDRHEGQIQNVFRNLQADRHFKDVLHTVRERLGRPVRICDIGCGAGYDLQLLQECFAPDEVELIVCFDISPEMMERARKVVHRHRCQFVTGDLDVILEHGPYDLIVTHAMVHHVPDLELFYSIVNAALGPDAVYIMGHEPNRRFRSSKFCLDSISEFHRSICRSKKLRKYVTPVRYVNKLRRSLGLLEETSDEQRVNRVLQERFGFTGELSMGEIRGLVDIHANKPDDAFSIGLNGFDWHELTATCLPGFELASVVTYAHLGESCTHAELSAKWRGRHDQLAKNHPFEGAWFTACWQKTQCASEPLPSHPAVAKES